MIQKGFGLLEVMVGLVLSSIIALILFQSLAQTNEVLARVVSTSSMERKVAMMQQQFETDFSGMFAPDLQEKQSDEEKNGAPNKKDTREKAAKKPDEQAEEQAFKTFSFESDDRGFVKILSFVTSNPLLVYQQPSPRAVRVAYRVSADPENQGKLLLVRQESEELSLASFESATSLSTIKPGQKPIRKYEIARDIESMKFEFYVEKIELPQPEKKSDTPEQSAKNTKKDTQEKKRVFVTIDEWKKLSGEEKKKYVTPEIPAFCSLTIFVNDEKKRVHSFEFWFYTPTGFAPAVVKGPSSLPSKKEVEQRQAAQTETDRIHLHGGIPQPGGQKP